MTIIYFILILSTVIFIHEFGHFIFAKKNGVYVYEFSLGMGPQIFKFHRKNDETMYSIRLLPIGGYVQMAGEVESDDKNIPIEKNLNSKKWHQKFMVIVAGILFNFLLAIVVFFIIGIFTGRPVGNPNINNIYKGDTIKKINEQTIDNLETYNNIINNLNDEIVSFELESSSRKTRTVKIIPISNNNKYTIGIGVTEKDKRIVIDSIDDKNILYENGLYENDTLLKINGKKVTNPDNLNLIFSLNYGKELKLEVESINGKTKNIVIKPEELKNDKGKTKKYNYGFSVKYNTEKGFFAAIKYAFTKFFSLIWQMILIVFYLFTGKLSLSSLSGPVGIFGAVNEAAKTGILDVLYLMGYISLNLGFMNFLPIPALDGGRLLFLIIEKIIGKPVKPKVENIIHTIGFMLLMLLIVVISFNDILKIFK